MPAPSSAPHRLFTQELAFPAVGNATRWSNRGDWLLLWLLRLCAGLAGIITLLIFTYLCAQSVPLLRTIGFLRLFTDQTWAPTSGHFTLVPMLLGTCSAALGALSVATPVSIALAIFVTFYAPPSLAGSLRGILGLLASLPSVVYGCGGWSCWRPCSTMPTRPGYPCCLAS
jgi:phosphate transport system permease protein